jgi:uridylate kinase
MPVKKLFVISLGGSLINPGQVDAEFLKKFRKLIIAQTKKGSRFILIAGGGALCRHYQIALRGIVKPSNNILDWMGIYTTRVNARLVQLMFGNLACEDIVKNPTKKIVFNKKVLVASGWKPGRSTDFVAVTLGRVYGSSTVINLSNIDYVYTKDPRKFKDAKKIENISWTDFRKIVGNKWDPGKNAPFDPTAARQAQKNRLRVIIANGKNLENLKNILEEKKFIGTVIN